MRRAWGDGGMLDVAAQLMHGRRLVFRQVDRSYTGVGGAEPAPMHPHRVVASRGLLQTGTATAVRATARNATAAFSDRNSPPGAPSACRPTQEVISGAVGTTQRCSVAWCGQSGLLDVPPEEEGSGRVPGCEGILA
jgi:hypothetical protein